MRRHKAGWETTSTKQTSFTRHSVFVFIASKKVNMSKRPKLSGAQGRKKRKEEEEKRDKDKGNVTVKMMLMIYYLDVTER